MSETQEVERAAESLQRREARKHILHWAIWTSIAAFICVVLAACCGRHWTAWVGAFGQGLLCAGGPAAVGILIGFLFGIPRATPPPKNGSNGKDGKDGKDGQNPPSTSFRPNTNLEEVSDWLTKILLGATLTQVKPIATAANDAAHALGVVFGGGEVGHTIGGLVIAFFTIAGFFTGYLITCLFLTREFKDLYDDLWSPDAARIVATLPPEKKTLANERMKKSATRDRGNVELRRVEEVMIASLYDDPPAGFARAIKTAKNYMSDAKRPRSASLHAWLACAYGQKYRWDHDDGAEKKRLGDSRDHALQNVKLALDLDKTWKDVLKGTLVSDGGDNDLSAFKDDPDFKALLLSP